MDAEFLVSSMFGAENEWVPIRLETEHSTSWQTKWNS